MGFEVFPVLLMSSNEQQAGTALVSEATEAHAVQYVDTNAQQTHTSTLARM